MSQDKAGPLTVVVDLLFVSEEDVEEDGVQGVVLL